MVRRDEIKIAVVTNYFPVREQPYRGHSAYQTIRQLAKKVPLHVFAPQSRYPETFRSRNRPWAQTDLSYVPADVEATYFHYPVLPVITRRINAWLLERKLEPLIRSYAPTVLLGFWIYPDCYAAIRVGRRLKIPVVVKALGSDLNCIKPGMESWQVRTVLRKADAVITVSDALRKRAIRLGADEHRTRAILNGCDGSIFYPRSKSICRALLNIPIDATLILFVGRLDPLKGVIELLRACKLLDKRFPRLRVAMVGEGPARSAIQQEAQRLGLTQRLQLAPPCSSEQVAKWLGASDIFALPSYNEGCPNVVIEALRSGRPVVSTRVGGIPELVNDQNGRLVAPRNVQALAGALIEALSLSWDPIGIGASGCRSWDDVAHEVYDVCQQVTVDRDEWEPVCVSVN